MQEVYRTNEYRRKDWKLYFWRTSHGAEVDLLIESAGRLVTAIEIKFKKAIASGDLNGLRSFHDEHPQAPCYLVAPVPHKLRIGFVDVLPPLEMLSVLAEDY